MSILHLEHISYTYEKSETPVLRDITADFEAVSYTHLTLPTT